MRSLMNYLTIGQTCFVFRPAYKIVPDVGQLFEQRDYESRIELIAFAWNFMKPRVSAVGSRVK